MTVTIRHGPLGAATTPITGQVRQPSSPGNPVGVSAWSLVEGAEKAATALSGLNVEDPSATSTLIGLQEVHVEDSLCTEPTVFAGFWDTRDVQRTETLRTGTQRQWDAQTTDLNALLGDHIIGSGKRPAETDITRIYWLLASGYCPIGTAGYIDTSSPVTLPAADYTGRTAADVLAEASNLSNLNYFVRWEQLASFSDSYSPWLSGLSSYVAPTGTWQRAMARIAPRISGAVGGPSTASSLTTTPPLPPRLRRAH